MSVRSATTCWLCRLFVGKIELGCLLSGRFDDTISLGWDTFCTRVQVGTARDALRYHAVGVQAARR